MWVIYDVEYCIRNHTPSAPATRGRKLGNLTVISEASNAPSARAIKILKNVDLTRNENEVYEIDKLIRSFIEKRS